MAHFRGTVQGGRTEASRLGHKSSGLRTVAASWQGAVEVRVYTCGDVDYCEVSLTRHHGAGVSHTLYRGPIGEYAPENK